MKLKPLQDRILIQRIEEEKTTKGGIIIPDTAKEKPAEGKVVAVGNGKLDENGKRVALVDDVMTTGATLDELARTLKAHGAARVENFLLARALKD